MFAPTQYVCSVDNCLQLDCHEKMVWGKIRLGGGPCLAAKFGPPMQKSCPPVDNGAVKENNIPLRNKSRSKQQFVVLFKLVTVC